ncbi:MAG: elongation factor G [Bacteroidota bacterium]|nr:elongation factor G [Bacteroidota bacterium]
MKVYQTKEIRNISILGSASSGKTTLSESLLLAGGVIERKGNVESKSSISDYRPIEHERLNSVKSTVLYSFFEDYKINIIDSPGFDDFAGEAISAMRVTDVSLMVLNSHNAIEVGTEIFWRHAMNYGQPLIFVANQLDHEKAEFDELVAKSKEIFGNKLVTIQYPLNQGSDFDSIIDVLKMKMFKFPKGGGDAEILPIPDSEKDKAEELQNELVEAAAENDEELMELFFDKGTLDEDEMRKGIRLGLMKRDLFPILCTSAKNDIGTKRLMEFITKVVPSPDDANAETLANGDELPIDSAKAKSAYVFKVSYEEHLGEVVFFKVITGEIAEGDEMENIQSQTKEKLSQLYLIAGKNREKVEKLVAGDIGATIKMKNTKINSSLNEKGADLDIKKTVFPEPKYTISVKAVNSTDDEKLGGILNKMAQEDSTFHFYYSTELKQMVIQGQGELHINIAKWHINKEHKIEIEFFPTKIPYRETITKESKKDFRHKKQSGGSGQFGEVYLMIEPYQEKKPDPPKDQYNIRGKEVIELPWGGKLVFYNAIVGGVIDTRYLPAILKGIMEKMEEGPLTGSYARDIRVVVYDGKMHPVDSNEISFKIAGRTAFKAAFKAANPKLLEPIYEIEVIVPEEKMGDVMTDLQGRRSIILGMEGEGVYQKIKAKVPLADLNKYSTALSSLTNGRGTYSMKFDGYEKVPPEIQQQLLKDYEASQEEE